MPSELYILEEQRDNKQDELVKSILCLLVVSAKQSAKRVMWE